MKPSLPIFGALMASACALLATNSIVNLNGLEITLNERTGGIVRMSYPATGAIIESSPEEAGLLDLAYPLQEFIPLRLATRYSEAKISKEENGVTIRYENLGPSRTAFKLPSGNVSAEISIRAAADKRSVILQCKLENHSKGNVPQILFPDFRGVRPFEGAAQTQLRFAGSSPITPFSEAPIPPDSAQFYPLSGWKEYPPTVGTYGINTLRWLNFGGYKGGLSIFQKAWGKSPRPVVRTYRSQADPSNLRLMWDNTGGLKPGAKWTSDEFWLTPHPGGWAKGIEVFRDYVRTVHPQRTPPARVRDGLGFRTILLMQGPETESRRADFHFTDLPKLAAEAKENGLVELCLWGWCDGFTLPFTLRPELGTREEFLDGIRQAKEMGVTVSPFISCVLVRNKFAQRYGGNPGGPAWVYHPEIVPMMDPYYLAGGQPVRFWDIFSVDTKNANWQSDVTGAFREWIDQGVTCWGWDQVFADAPGSGGLTDLTLKLRAMAREKDPDAIFSGEQVGSLEMDAGVLDYTWNWADYTDTAPVTSVMRAPRLNCNVEDSPRVVKMGFADNLFLNIMPRKPDGPNGTAYISSKPTLVAALKQTAALRQKFLPYFTEGTFIGDSVRSEAGTGFVRGYQLGDKLFIIALNTETNATKLAVKSSLDLWSPKSSSYNVRAYDNEGKLLKTTVSRNSNWSAKTAMLQPLEFAFYEISAVPGN